uniref:Uncharacterized protein n=1 Tax=Oryzias latipes TaxID=8090 RepID=A0A286P9T0_ORYLA|nr:hypothetical protein ORF44-like [Oryzias latipes]
MQRDGRSEEHGCESFHGARVSDGGVVRSGCHAKAALVQAYLECLHNHAVCHNKIRQGSRDSSSVRAQLVRLLTSKAKAPVEDYGEAYSLCSNLWDSTLRPALVGSDGLFGEGTVPDCDELSKLRGREAMLRVALLVDFYRFQAEDLFFDESHSSHKALALRLEAFRLISDQRAEGSSVVRPPSREKSGAPLDGEAGPQAKSRRSRAGLGANERGRRVTRVLRTASPFATLRTTSAPLSSRPEGDGSSEDPVKWSRFCFAPRRRSYHCKLVRAFQCVKASGHSMLALNSEWPLSCYYRLAAAYTTDRPLEMAAACIPQLREAADMISREQFGQLRSQSPERRMLLYAVLSCHINWIDYNHKQILLAPVGLPGRDRARAAEGDLRCVRCLKNQTFRSSEVKGNPRNIDVAFDFEQMKFVSSCCAAPVANVPLSTSTVNTCTFTDLKQMYTVCPACKQTIFSEVLVDLETLHTRCVFCASNRIGT